MSRLWKLVGRSKLLGIRPRIPDLVVELWWQAIEDLAPVDFSNWIIFEAWQATEETWLWE